MSSVYSPAKLSQSGVTLTGLPLSLLSQMQPGCSRTPPPCLPFLAGGLLLEKSREHNSVLTFLTTPCVVATTWEPNTQSVSLSPFLGSFPSSISPLPHKDEPCQFSCPIAKTPNNSLTSLSIFPIHSLLPGCKFQTYMGSYCFLLTPQLFKSSPSFPSPSGPHVVLLLLISSLAPWTLTLIL